jgi:hypothetical protein
VPIEARFITAPRLTDGEMLGLRVPHNVQVFSLVSDKPVLVALSSSYDGPFALGEDFGLSAPPLQTNALEPRLLMLRSFPSKFMTGEQQGRSEPYTPPGQFAARYSVQTFTNFLGLQIPVAYRMDVLWPGFGGLITNQGVALEFVGTVTSISSINSPVGPPEVLGGVAVDDYRYQDPRHPESPLHYSIHDREWKP